jgi:hypothetical protein
MKYEKNQYSEGFSICALIIAGAFFYWAYTNLTDWTYGFPWWGFIALAIGIAIAVGQIAALLNRDKLRNAVLYEYEQNPNASIEEVSRKTGITQKDVRAITLDLKGTGKLRGSFSTKSGTFKAIIPEKTPEAKAKYCPGCGTPIKKEGAQFCGYCGSKIE